jgi:CRISPR-associated exonuclease Cas4
MDLIPVTELKQWVYCKRIVYYHGVMPGMGQATYKMREAVRAQEMIEALEMRRTLKEYGLDSAERQFGVWVSDRGLGLSGKLDLLLKGEERSAVVDFKLTSGGVGENHRMQLAGYAALVEAVLKERVNLAFLYRIPDNRVFPVPITAEMKGRVASAVREIRRVLEVEELPEATEVRGRCVECEYANYCGDVW